MASKLSWSHYYYLIYIENDNERKLYENECINCRWSKRELERQIDSSLYQRLLLAKGDVNKQKIYELSTKGQTINTPNYILKELSYLNFGFKRRKNNFRK